MMSFVQDILSSPRKTFAPFRLASPLIFGLFALLLPVLSTSPAHANYSQGLNSAIGSNLPIGAGGTVEITVYAPVAPATTGTVNFSAPVTEGGTTINVDGSTTISSNNGTSPALTAIGAANFASGKITLNADGSIWGASGQISLLKDGSINAASGKAILGSDGSAAFTGMLTANGDGSSVGQSARFSNGQTWISAPDGGMQIANGQFVLNGIDGNLSVAGTAWFAHSASWCGATGCGGSSDRRLKKDITPITDALDVIEKLQGVRYHWRTPKEREVGKSMPLPLHTPQIGFIAQDVEKLVPEAVSVNKQTGIYGLEEQKIVPLLVEAMKEQQAEIDALKAALAK